MAWLFLSTLLFTFNNVLWKKFLPVSFTFKLVFIRAVYSSLLLLLLYRFMDGNFFRELSTPGFYIILISCVLGAMGLFALVSYLKNGRLYNLGYYNMAGTALAGLYTFFFVKEKLQGFFFMPAMLLLAIGYLFFIHIKNNQKKEGEKSINDHLLLWIMVFSFTGAMITQSMALNHFSFVTLAFTQELVILIMAGLASIVLYKKDSIKNITILSWQPILMAVIIVAAVLTSLAGLKITSPLASAVFGLLVPLFTFFGGVFFFKEKAVLQHYVAMVLMLGGCLMMLL